MNPVFNFHGMENLRSSLGQKTEPTPATEPIATEPKRVLIVDDDTLVRDSLACVLRCEGYQVFGAADGHEAVQSVIDHLPDLVLLDLNMPKMDGWTAFAKFEHVRPLMPVIVITARPHQYKHAIRLGVDAFMEKPLNIPVLLCAIQRLTHESEESHTRRIIDPNFITQMLASDR